MARRSYTKPLLLAVLVVFGVAVYLQYRYYSSSTPTKDSPDVSNLVDRFDAGGPGKDGIPSIDDPRFESVTSANEYLDDAGLGIDVEVNGKHRFYPFQILVWHELVNDTFGDRSFLITYSPLTFTTAVFDRTFDSVPSTFGVSGDLYDSNTVLYDRETDTRWLQVSGKAIDGTRVGMVLKRYPSTVMSWSAFKSIYANGAVLSRTTGVVRDYTRDPYDAYHANNAILFSLSAKDDRYHPKSIVYGFENSVAQKAYFEEAMIEQELINDRIGDINVLLVRDEELETVKAFDRRANDRVLTFELDDQVLVDKETKTRWNLDGMAFSGALRGKQLFRIPLELSYWFSWYATYPETDVFSKN